MQKRVVVVANKWWECDPLLNVLLHDNARPAELGWPIALNHPRRRPDQKSLPPENQKPVPRAVFSLVNINVEVWCISDLLEHLPDKPESQSSSERKVEQLLKIFVGQAPDLVIAVGTAGIPSLVSENGSVVVGTRVFMHNAHPNGENPNSNWQVGPFDKTLPSKLDRAVFSSLTAIETTGTRPSVMDRFLVTPLNPAGRGILLAGYDYIAMGSVNVTNYKEYSQTDKATVDAYLNGNDPAVGRSLETTHGLIRVQSDAPFIFISGITDRVGHFDDEVGPRSYAQNTVAAHNAGIVLAWMIPKVNASFSS
jgi:hypothetical protein